MPADHQRSSSVCRAMSLRAALLAVLLMTVALGGCASFRSGTDGPVAPDLSSLDPAQQALATAIDAQASDFAPRSIDASRRRITVARDILYTAAEQGRPLTDNENKRVDQLVYGAKLDAKAALVETQAKAVQAKIAQLQQQANGSDSSTAPASGPQNADSSSTGLGLSAFGDARNKTGASQ